MQVWLARWYPKQVKRVAASLSAFALAACSAPSDAAAPSAQETSRANSTFSAACAYLGMCPTVQADPDVEVLAIDFSDGSPATPAVVTDVVDAMLDYAATRPGTTIYIYKIGSTIETTVQMGQAITSPTTPTGHQAASWKNGMRSSLLTSIAHALSGPPPTASPIAEAVTKIALATASVHHRRLFLVSDLRQMSSLGSLECRDPIPSIATFEKHLAQIGALPSHSLENTDVFVVGDLMLPVKGCTLELNRVQQATALFKAAFLTAGATAVSLSATAPLIQ
jgi:hypothetical protein